MVEDKSLDKRNIKRAGWPWPFLDFTDLLKKKSSVYKDIRKYSKNYI